MSKVIENFGRPFVVEAAETITLGGDRRTPARWEFVKGCFSLADAQDYAAVLSEDHEFVRIVKREVRDA